MILQLKINVLKGKFKKPDEDSKILTERGNRGREDLLDICRLDHVDSESDTILSASQILTHLLLLSPYEINPVMIATLQMRNLWLTCSKSALKSSESGSESKISGFQSQTSVISYKIITRV